MQGAGPARSHDETSPERLRRLSWTTRKRHAVRRGHARRAAHSECRQYSPALVVRGSWIDRGTEAEHLGGRSDRRGMRHWRPARSSAGHPTPARHPNPLRLDLLPVENVMDAELVALLLQLPDEIRADESGTAGDQDSHRCSLSCGGHDAGASSSLAGTPGPSVAPGVAVTRSPLPSAQRPPPVARPARSGAAVDPSTRCGRSRSRASLRAHRCG